MSAHHVEHVMGMAVSLDVRGDVEGAGRLVADAVAWLRRVDATFSTYRSDSPVSRLGRGEIGLADAPAEVAAVLARCDELRAATDGYFDAWAGGRLDPSALVKGWAVDVASARLSAGGATDHCVNAGGDVRTRGAPAPGRCWRVGIAHPLLADALCAVVTVGDGAVATSGISERGAHVVDPHTGTAALDLASVTVVGRDLALADAFATAALAMGLAAPEWLAGLDGHQALVVDAGGHVWSTPGFGRSAVNWSKPAPRPVG